MEIQFHDTIRSGLYIGTLSPNYTRLLYEFIADMRIEMPGELKPGIISDINEWALILQEKGNKNYYLYHNYAMVDENHKYFSTFMEFLPFVMSSSGKIEKNKDVMFEAEDFRKSEFQRNLNE